VADLKSIYNVSSPMEIKVVKEGLNFHAFIVTNEGYLHQLNFGTNFSEGIAAAFNNGRFDGVFGTPTAIEIVRTAPNWKGLVIDYVTGKLTKIAFSGNCRALKYETNTAPELSDLTYGTSGNYAVELNAFHSNGNVVALQKEITISTVTAPSVDISMSENRCLNVEKSFAAVGEGINSYSWSFGDGTSDSNNTASVTHQYSTTGSKDVTLSIIAQNGCHNTTKKTIAIFNPPAASFTLPSHPHCTNQLYTFNNSSTFDVGSDPSWQWFVDNQELSTEKDLQHAFANTTDASIKLIASIPGCSSTVTRQFTSLIAGPMVDFNVVGKCDQEGIQFTSNISQPITSLSWSFGDGKTDTNPNPKNLFPGPGKYDVQLSTVSPSGCNNSATKKITIFTNPQPDFLVDGAPNSCTSALTKFTNQTQALPDGEINSWLWSFSPGPSGSSTTENPSYQFSTAGDYNVSLKAVTKEGCSGTTQKSVPILQGPTATISNTPSCVGVPINFSASGSGLDSYYWEMGTSYYTAPTPSHTFNLPGTFTSKLTVTSANNCQSTVSKQLVVPVVLVPDFSVIRNCVGYDTQLTDLTSGSDPVVQRDWEVAGMVNKTGSPVLYNFASTGPRTVKLTVKSQAGCNYSRSKPINIVAAPVANFTVDPQSGGVPLVSQFTNTSLNATKFNWKFGDGINESNANSPSFTFTSVGEYSVELTASNAEGCESNTSKIISAQTAVEDVEVKVINYTTNPDGSLKVIVTLQNNGNTILRNLPVDIDVSGITTLREIVPGPINPSTLYNLVLGSTFTVPERLNFFCAASSLTNDVTPENNRVCKELREQISLLDSYPNPVKQNLIINWIASQNEPVTIEIIDMFGKIVLSNSQTSSEGLNEFSWDAGRVENGLYIVKMTSKSSSKTERILIAR
jgi:PKD repeat protein